MIDCIDADAGSAWRVTSSMTQTQAAGLLVAGQKLLTADAGVRPVAVDLTGVGEADSSGLAVLLDWLRTARQQGRMMTVHGMPDGLRSLAELYGIEELLGFV
jgi:phospholipid transport system transporter-binding protein